MRKSTSSYSNGLCLALIGMLILLIVGGRETFAQSSKDLNAAPASTSSATAGNLWVTGYYQDYAVCTMPPSQIDYTALTHIIFFHTDVDVNVEPYFLPVVSAAESIRVEWSDSRQGCARSGGESYQAELIRRSHTAGVKVLLCLGGIYGAGATRMSQIAVDSVKTQAWTNSLIAYLVRKGFDGVDLDWEFPQSQADYMRMLRILRRGLDSMPARGVFTAAVYGDANSSAYDYPNLKNYLDQVNVMTYDMWNNQNTAWLNSPLSKPVGSPNNWRTWRTSSALSWAARGVPKSILSDGIPFYSWRFTGVTGLGQPLGGTSYAEYSDAVNALNTGGTYHWDDSAKAPYVTYTNASNGVNYMITYDDTNSIRYKVQRVKDDGIGGIMIYGLWDGWLNSAPAGKKDILLQAIKAAVGGTIVLPLPPPTQVSPSEGALNVPPATTLTWTSIGGATSYGLQVAGDALFTSLLVNENAVTSTSFPVTLNSQTTYYWRVNTRNSAGVGAWSAVRDFQTAGGTRISGVCFFDMNRNGIQGAAEPSMAGWVVHLSGPVSATTVTDSSGSYRFDDMPVGQYTVSVDVKSLWSQTSPMASSAYVITVTDGSAFDTATFGLYSALAFPFDVSRYWNIVALPVVNPDNRTTSVFSLATTQAYSFNSDDGYFAEDTLSAGPAYWIKFGGAHTVWSAGSRFSTASVEVAKGWNFVGSVSTPIPSTNLVSIPPGIIIGNVFGYKTGNYIADSLEPGQGYWVQTSDSGTIVVSSLALNTTPGKENASSAMKNLNSVTFTTRNGESQSLYFGVDRTSPASMRYDMPPLPPTGVFDARFTSGGSTGMIASVLRTTPDHAVEFPLALHSAAFPLKITWDVRSSAESYALRIAGGPAATLSGQGSLTIDSPSPGTNAAGLETMSVVVEGSSVSSAPKSFALEQNYPNPFNPSTTIGFTLSSASAVRLEVFNVLGERVALPVDRDMAAGTYSIPFDASSLPSGVYFYKLSAIGAAGASFVRTNRMVLSK